MRVSAHHTIECDEYGNKKNCHMKSVFILNIWNVFIVSMLSVIAHVWDYNILSEYRSVCTLKKWMNIAVGVSVANNSSEWASSHSVKPIEKNWFRSRTNPSSHRHPSHILRFKLVYTQTDFTQNLKSLSALQNYFLFQQISSLIFFFKR